MNLDGISAAPSRRFSAALATALAAALLMTTALVGPAAADHVACGTTISASTTLHGDVGPCPGDGLVVDADGITLDLNGFRVFAANGDGNHAGIRLADVSGVTVRNGTVTGFDAGVLVEGGAGNTVRQIVARDNINDFTRPPCLLGDGIAVQDSSNNTITQNQVINNGPFGGITIIGDSDNNLIRSNRVRDNNIVTPVGQTGCGNRFQDEGIRIEGPGAEGNRVDNNVVENGLLAGIGLHGTVCNLNPTNPPEPYNRGNIVTNNKVSGTAGTSIASGINILRQGPSAVVCPAQETTIVGNTSTGNQADGIFVGSNSRGNTINRNAVNDNGLSGIFLGGPLFAQTFRNLGPTLLDVVTPDLPPYVEGTDYQVMPGSGSGDVTARLVAIDIALHPNATATSNPNPVDTSTSACERSDFTNAGFQAGDVALIQRGTCTFVAKVANAVAAGASAVVMFNEGQTPGRTTHNFGSVGPQSIPVLST
jgi:parallel beta-helix repeat protein